jgi:hypothetical protein
VLLGNAARVVYSLATSVLRLGSLRLYSARHTAPFLRLFVPIILTVHPRSFSLKALLAACSFCPATPGSDYSPAVTSSAPFLGLFVPNNSMVQRRFNSLFTHSLFIHAWEAGFSTLPVPPLRYFIFFVLEGVVPSTSAISSFAVTLWKFRLHVP